jgi:hypothetical protein
MYSIAVFATLAVTTHLAVGSRSDCGNQEVAEVDDDDDAAVEAAVRQAWKCVHAGFTFSASFRTLPCPTSLREELAGAGHAALTDTVLRLKWLFVIFTFRSVSVPIACRLQQFVKRTRSSGGVHQ